MARKHSICIRLRNIMVGRGLSYGELAHLARMPYSTVYGIMEGNTKFPRVDTLEKLIVGLDLGDIPVVEQRQRSPASNVVRLRRA